MLIFKHRILGQFNGITTVRANKNSWRDDPPLNNWLFVLCAINCRIATSLAQLGILYDPRRDRFTGAYIECGLPFLELF